MKRPSRLTTEGSGVSEITAEMFKKATGVDPFSDDLGRCNCEKAGQVFHTHCGWDKERNLPNFWPKNPHVEKSWR